MNHIKEQFKNKTAEQVYVMSLLIGCFCLMLVCAITRLCGVLWFSADLSLIHEPSEFWRDLIMNFLFVFELTFVYKILCRSKWRWCILISIAQCLLLKPLPENWMPDVVNLVLYFLVPFLFVRNWHSLVDSAFLYAGTLLYCILFLVGRIGNLDVNSEYNFIYSVLGAIDYKLFIVTIYWFIKYYGGIRLWKTQKRLICQKDL